MSTPMPRPAPRVPLDPATILAAVDVALMQRPGDLAGQAVVFDGVHQQLAVALSTVDGI